MGKATYHLSILNEARLEAVLDVLTATDERERRDVEFLEGALELEDDRLISFFQKRSRNLPLAATMVTFAGLGGNLRDFVTDTAGAMALGYGVSDYAAKVVELLKTVTHPDSRQAVLERLGYRSPAPQLLPIDKKYLAVEVATDYLSHLAERDTVVVLLDAVRDRTPEELDLLLSNVKRLVPDRPLRLNDLQTILKLSDDAARLAPRDQLFWTNTRIALVKSSLDNEALHRAVRASPCGLLLVLFGELLFDSPLFPRLQAALGDAIVSSSIDRQRAIVSGFLAIQQHPILSPHLRRVVSHTIEACENPRELTAVYRELSFCGLESIEEFRFDLRGYALVASLAAVGLTRALKSIGLTSEDCRQIEGGLDRVNRSGLLGTLIHLHRVHERQGYVHGMELVKETIRRLPTTDPEEYRYTLHHTERQMSAFQSSAVTWRENLRLVKYVGSLSGFRSDLQAIRSTATSIRAELRKELPDMALQLSALQSAYDAQVDLLRVEANRTDEAIDFKISLERSYKTIAVLDEIHKKNIEHLLELDGPVRNLAKSWKDSPAVGDLFCQIEAILARTREERRQIRRLVISETDDLDDLINVGMQPIRTCQRWNEETDFNPALLSYVLDANKKLVHIKTNDREIVARAVLRLIPATIQGSLVPMILLERPYYTQWSQPFVVGILQLVFQKARRLAEAAGKMCAIGVSAEHGADWRRHIARIPRVNQEGEDVLCSLELPPSVNMVEYSDTLAPRSLISTGERLDVRLHVIRVASTNGKRRHKARRT